MPLNRIATIEVWKCLSTDDKPSSARPGSILQESDTGRTYRFLDSSWVLDWSADLTVGMLLQLSGELRPIIENILLEITAANRANGVVP